MAALIRMLWPQSETRQWVSFVVFILFMLVGPLLVIPDIWATAWQEGGWAYGTIETVFHALGIGFSPVVVYPLPIGIFLGFSAVWFVDTFRKTGPAIVLWVGIIWSCILFWLVWSSPFAELSVSVLLVVVGISIGLQLGGIPLIGRIIGDKKRLLPMRRPERHFARAVRGTLYCLIILALVGLVEYYIAQGESVLGSGSIQHIVGMLFVLTPVFLFQQYSDTERIILLGPARSGKTSIQGGLYMDTDSEWTAASQLLRDEVYKKNMKFGDFPDRTRINPDIGTPVKTPTTEHDTTDTDIEEPKDGDSTAKNTNALTIEFQYITANRLFPKEKTITAVDYPGEILTESETDSGSRLPGIAGYVGGEDVQERSWSEAMSFIQGEVEPEIEEEDMKRNLATLIHNADVLLFIFPLDDFLAPVATDEKRQENIPGYHRDSLWEIEECRETEDAEYRTRSVEGDDEWINIVEEYGNMKPKDGAQIPGGVPLDEDRFLGDDEHYYVRTKRTRSHPREYVSQYKGVIENLEDDRDYHYIWMCTMADLVVDDFRAAESKSTPVSEVEDAGSDKDGGIKIANEDGKPTLKIFRPDIESGLVSDLVRQDKNWTIKSDETPYKVFSEWIMNEYLYEESDHIESLLDGTGEEFVYPLWFEINGTEACFLPEVGLKGSPLLKKRLRGGFLKRNYPIDRRIMLKRTILNNNNIPLSQSQMLYQLLATEYEDTNEEHEDT